MTEPTKVIIKRDISDIGREPYILKTSFELPWDAKLEDWIDLFRKILICEGFNPDTVNEFLP